MSIDLTPYGYTKRAAYVKSVLTLGSPMDYKALSAMGIKKGDRGCGIYGIFNVKTKGLYVGSTSDFHKRITGHYNNIKNGKSYRYLNVDTKKTGAEAFVFIKIHEVPREDLIVAENFWMSSLSANYNERKAVELKIPIESKRAGRKNGVKTMAHYSAPVVKYSLDMELIKEYPSVRAAAVDHGGKHLAYKISKCCRGKIDSAFDGVWQYKNGMTPAKPKHVKQLIDFPVVQINMETGDFIKIWESGKVAALHYGLKPGSIRSVCENQKNGAGFYWRYANLQTFFKTVIK